jgi:hypothetical protein
MNYKLIRMMAFTVYCQSLPSIPAVFLNKVYPRAGHEGPEGE